MSFVEVCVADMQQLAEGGCGGQKVADGRISDVVLAAGGGALVLWMALDWIVLRHMSLLRIQELL